MNIGQEFFHTAGDGVSSDRTPSLSASPIPRVSPPATPEGEADGGQAGHSFFKEVKVFFAGTNIVFNTGFDQWLFQEKNMMV